jgi:hypothetical protein
MRRLVITLAVLLASLSFAPSALADGPCYAASSTATVYTDGVGWSVLVKCTSRSNYVFRYSACEAIAYLPDDCTSDTDVGPYNIGPYSSGGAIGKYLKPSIGGCDRDRDTNTQYWKIRYKSTSTGIWHSIGTGGRISTHLACSFAH